MTQLTLAHIFYNQHRMLKFHEAAWKMHSPPAVKYLFVDDGSPVPLQFKNNNNLHITIARIMEDIPWNIAGARNLAFHVARTRWILCADIDHVVSCSNLEKIKGLPLNDPDIVYTFARKNRLGILGRDAIVNFLMCRDTYLRIGGHDEDFSGHYGREETFFRKCLVSNGLTVINREDIILDWYPEQGATRGLQRDKSHNARLFETKLEQLNQSRYINGETLRFGWRVDSSTT